MSPSPLSLRAHDVCTALQLCLTPDATYRELADRTGQSVGESHNSAKRLESARLHLPHRRGVNRVGLVEFLVSGVPYAFPGELGPETRGIATAFSGPDLAEIFEAPNSIVWPSVDGDTRGSSLTPLCSRAPSTVQTNRELYRLLTLVDALRVGRARERRIASEILRDLLLAPSGTE